MRDYIALGSTPCAESCAQVGAADYREKASEECRRYKALLLKKFGNPPVGARFAVKGFNHDFGRYFEVVVEFDDNFPEAVDFAFDVEADLPEYWDEA